MFIEFFILLAVSILFLILGWLIWKKEKINLIHSYHYDKVAEADKKAYTALMGKGVIIIGLGMLATGIIDLATRSGWGWIAFGVSFAVGIGFMIFAGIRYNR